MTLSQKNYYPALTGFRALAAFMVFFHHANPFSFEGVQIPFFLFTNELHIGVSFFFVLSGFLIYSRYHSSPFKSNNRFIHYLQNRFARIYPLYFLLTIITFIAYWKVGKFIFDTEGLFIFFTNLTLLKGFFNELKFTGIAQGWSLTVEECFYFTAPLIFLWWNRFKWIIPILLIVMGCLFVTLFQSISFYGFFFDLHFMFVYTFFGRCIEFLAGVALGHYIVQNKREPAFKYFTISGGVLIILVILSLVVLGHNGQSGLEHPVGLIINNFILPIGIVALIFGLIHEQTWMQRLLSSPTGILLGKSSYAFYLIHAGIFYTVIYQYITGNILLIFLLMNIIAVALYYFIEKPLHEKWRAKEINTY